MPPPSAPTLVDPGLDTSGPAVVVDEVATVGAGSLREPGAPIQTDELRGARLERPRPSESRDTYSLLLSGWALGRTHTPSHVEVRERDSPYARLALERPRPDVADAHDGPPDGARCGFLGMVGAAGLPRRFELSVEAVLVDDRRVPLWTVRGRRAPLLDAPATGLRPIVLRGAGRTGSTWLMCILEQHPAIAAYGSFAYEPRLLPYWLEVARAVAEPGSHLGALRPRYLQPNWWLGHDEAVDPLPARDDRLHAVLGREAPRRLAGLARAQINSFYETVASEQGKPAATCFAEKGFPLRDRFRQLWRMLDDVYPDVRHVMLVRDPRDMVCSILAYDRRRGSVGFGRELVGSDQEFLRWLREQLLNLMAEYRAGGDRWLVVRYEDLVREPRRVVGAILEHVGVEHDPRIVKGILADASAKASGQLNHRTAGDDAEASIGRWRRDLPPHLRADAAREFGGLLSAFGYE